ncbi:DUF680 domain-containing protein [Mesorhizobium sp. SP-1A]|uniref:DUF680 domain-containing protein n=1 Tax=Mesorhizobium sp. SP-1A TaxID=3077840 RepID=UPI0028F6D3EC|nr:DUF680 domain-containing protein [Mesorhizobium sp. SP-1A]
MRKIALALAALTALSGSASACGHAKAVQAQAPATCTHNSVKLDCKSTGTIAPAGIKAPGDREAAGKPRLGIDINPWVMPSGF